MGAQEPNPRSTSGDDPPHSSRTTDHMAPPRFIRQNLIPTARVSGMGDQITREELHTGPGSL